MAHVQSLRLLLCAAALAACSSSSDKPAGPLSPDTTGPGGAAQGATGSNTTDTALPDVARSTRSSLQWKRYAAFEADLSLALDLPKEELCNEFGKDPCIRSVHLSPLGGHNPITTGLLESPSDTLAATSTVVERVVLSACLARVAKDRELGKGGVLFGGFDLGGPAPAPDAPEVSALISALYKRFHARDADAVEIDTLSTLTRDAAGAAVPASTFAATLCMAVGTTTEFLFF